MSNGKHKNVYSNDDAYKCFDCEASWGVLPGNSKRPKKCDKERIQLLNMQIKTHKGIIVKLEALKESKDHE